MEKENGNCHSVWLYRDFIRDNGKDNGNSYSIGLYRDYFRGYIGFIQG